MRIALATSGELPEGCADDRPLLAALRATGAEVGFAVWSDPAVEWAAFDGVLLRSTWDYAERRAAFLAWSARVASTTPLHNPPTVVRWNTHKGYLAALAAHAPCVPGVALPRGPAPDPGALLVERGWSGGVLKPMVGATAREALRFRADEDGLERARAHVARLAPTEDLLLQPYLDGVTTEGELTVVLVEEEPCLAVRKLPARGNWRVQEEFGGATRPVRPPDEVTAAATAACRAARAATLERAPLLYARADFLPDGRGAWLLSELELVEPELYLRHDPRAAERLAAAYLRRLSGEGPASPG